MRAKLISFDKHKKKLALLTTEIILGNEAVVHNAGLFVRPCLAGREIVGIRQVLRSTT